LTINFPAVTGRSVRFSGAVSRPLKPSKSSTVPEPSNGGIEVLRTEPHRQYQRPSTLKAKTGTTLDHSTCLPDQLQQIGFLVDNIRRHLIARPHFQDSALALWGSFRFLCSSLHRHLCARGRKREGVVRHGGRRRCVAALWDTSRGDIVVGGRA